ncbi:hypothetical protein JCM6294_3750 [Bacteroides pyogenes DSM 20611 = JCM 6294]|uniref:Uncharacterized protein n=1 Tax=Bacteroides pyogenes DSM 20611 = JCM 6294 TaxID=1121100 RepID=W4PN45_9BACE|nr:hypothetical protein JCM6294_3750 [Bacteroides pyogenes DSM 20611 = JCM 6294]
MSLESLVRGDFRNILPNGYCKKSFSNGRHWKIMKRRHLGAITFWGIYEMSGRTRFGRTLK